VFDCRCNKLFCSRSLSAKKKNISFNLVTQTASPSSKWCHMKPEVLSKLRFFFFAEEEKKGD